MTKEPKCTLEYSLHDFTLNKASFVRLFRLGPVEKHEKKNWTVAEWEIKNRSWITKGINLYHLWERCQIENRFLRVWRWWEWWCWKRNMLVLKEDIVLLSISNNEQHLCENGSALFYLFFMLLYVLFLFYYYIYYSSIFLDSWFLKTADQQKE